MTVAADAEASVLDEGISSPANHSWLDTLQAMERAFNAVQATEVVTSSVIREVDVERIRHVHGYVSAWLKDGHSHAELEGQGDALLTFFGLPLTAEENEGSHDVL